MKKSDIIFYGGDMVDGDGLIECGLETKARLQKGVDYIKQHPRSHFRIFLAAGIPPRRPHIGYMRNYMKEYLLELLDGIDVEVIIVPVQKVYGSFEETLAIIQVLMKQVSMIQEIVLVSTDRHMLRIKLGWWFLSRKTRIIPVTCAFEKANYNLEWLKILETFIFASTLYFLGNRPYEWLSDLKNKYIDH